MNFISIHQYFSRLQSVFFALLVLPMLAFIALYFFSDEYQPDPRIEYYVLIISAVLLDWVMAMVIFNKKIKTARNAQGLGAKLEKYFHITTVRYCFLCSSGIILAIGFYLSGSDVFTIMYLAALMLSVLLWPTGPRVSRDLMLRGDERQMVYFKRDVL